jgi:hypothetical protein
MPEVPSKIYTKTLIRFPATGVRESEDILLGDSRPYLYDSALSSDFKDLTLPG